MAEAAAGGLGQLDLENSFGSACADLESSCFAELVYSGGAGAGTGAEAEAGPDFVAGVTEGVEEVIEAFVEAVVDCVGEIDAVVAAAAVETYSDKV